MNKKLFLALSLFATIALLGCSAHKIAKDSNIKIYTNNTKTLENTKKLTKQELEKLKNYYLQKHFSPWTIAPNTNKNEVFWIAKSLENGAGWAQNTKRYEKDETKAILKNMNISAYLSAPKKAIITQSASVRAAPSIAPKFDTQDDYPFDMWQNSLIFYGTPVLITHSSLDGRWVHIQSAFVSGWVEQNFVALVSAAQMQQIMSWKDYMASVKDKYAIKNLHSFITHARIGQIFAIKSGAQNVAHNFDKLQNLKPQNVEIYTFLRNDNGELKISSIQVDSSKFVQFPQDFDFKLTEALVLELVGDKYGWGGLYEERDCSAFTRDILAVNGIFLPRNSKAQVYFGKNFVDLSKMQAKEKEQYIIHQAMPYYTILWKQGHIVLYVGQKDDKAMIAHSVWAVSKNRKKFVIGGVVVTDLHLQMRVKKGLFGRKNMLETIGGMNDLYELRNKILSKM